MTVLPISPLRPASARIPPPAHRRRAPRVGTLFAHRALDAFAKSLVCFALMHQIVLAVHAARSGDASVFNVFTMIEAHRLAPWLGSGAIAAALSLPFAAAVYALVYARFTRRRRVPEAPTRPRAFATAAPRSAPASPERTGARLRLERGWRPTAHTTPLAWPARLPLAPALLVAAAGVTVHMGALALIERFVTHFPPVPDVVHAHLPYVDFGVPGELCFAAYLAIAIGVLLARQRHQAAEIVALLGLYYGLRGLFLFVLPIGVPPTAPPLDARFVLYPFAGHAYFPGGHAGVMTILSLAVTDRRWRIGLLAATAVFGFGTLLARTHYTADVLGGFVVGFAVWAWGERWLRLRAAALRG